MDDYENWDDGDTARSGGMATFWEGLHPGVRSALWFWLFLLGIAVLNTLTGGGSVVICYPLQLLLYVANGALAARLALAAGYAAVDLPRVGAIAGFVAWILPAVYYLVFDLLLGIFTLGIGLVGVATWVLCGPIELIVQTICGAIGAWLYGRRMADAIY